MRSILRPRVLAGLLLGLVILYALIGFFLLPYIIEAYVIPSAAERLKRPVVLREAAFNPFTLALTLKGLEVREPDQTPILGFEELLVNLHAATMLFQSVSFDEIHLVMPFIAAKVNREGKLNLLSLIPPAEEPVAAEPEPPTTGTKKRTALYVESLNIDQGIVEYLDESKAAPVTIDIVPIHISLRDFSTVEGTENAYAFRAEIGHEEILAWEGSVSLDPVESDGRLTLTGLQVRTLYQAVQDRFRFDVLDGQVGVVGTYHFDLAGGTPHVTVKNGNVSLVRLALAQRGETTPVVEIPAFDVEAIGFDLAGRSVTIGKVHSSDARFAAWIDPDGVMNYQPMFTPSRNRGEQNAAAPPAAEESGGQPWSVAVNEVELRNYHSSFEDRTLNRPSHLEVEALDLSLKNVRLPFKEPFPVDLSLTLNGSGLIGLRGQLAMDPMAADVDLMIKHVGIRPFQPYLDQYANVDVRDGALDLSGSLHYAKVHPQGPLLRFQGAVAVNDLSITDRNDFNDVVTWKSLAVNRLALDVEPTAVKIGEVIWQQPAAHVVVHPDGTLNLSGLMAAGPRPDAQADSAPPKQKGQTPPVAVSISLVKLVNAAATFHDLSIQPAVKTAVSELSGTIKGLSSKEIARADVALAGKLGAGAPLKVQGQINPLTEDAYTDLTVLFENIDLTTASPYAGKYAGYPIRNGKLFLDLKYKVAKKELIGENKVLIDQLTFGEKTDSPDATSLPVPLAVALLKDRKGQIDVDLPVRGDLKDPEFKYGRVVLNAVLNLLAKVATSPLSLLGNLVGGSGDDLQFVDFPPGQSQLSDAATKKLNGLEKVLTERPGLFLEITGTADPQKDRSALAEENFRARLLQMKHGGADATPPGEDQRLSQEEEEKLINQWYAAQFKPQAGTAGVEPAVSEKRARLMNAVPVEDSQFRRLAQNRAAGIRARLLASGTVEEDRLVLREVEITDTNEEFVRTRLGVAGR